MSAAVTPPALSVGDTRGNWEVILLVPRKEGVKARMVRVRCLLCSVAQMEMPASELLAGRRRAGCVKCWRNALRARPRT